MEYKNVLKEVENQNPTLILGNGFSLAYGKEFSYKELSQKMTDDHEGEEAIQAFMYIVENLNVVDVEKILGHIGFLYDF